MHLDATAPLILSLYLLRIRVFSGHASPHNIPHKKYRTVERRLAQKAQHRISAGKKHQHFYRSRRRQINKADVKMTRPGRNADTNPAKGSWVIKTARIHIPSSPTKTKFFFIQNPPDTNCLFTTPAPSDRGQAPRTSRGHRTRQCSPVPDR